MDRRRRFVAALAEQFGDRALAVAERQIALAPDDSPAVAVWQQIAADIKRASWR